jgi:hypothetical protein
MVKLRARRRRIPAEKAAGTEGKAAKKRGARGAGFGSLDLFDGEKWIFIRPG